MMLPGISLVLKIASFVIASWFLVHLLAIFGVFVAISLPLWRLLFPQKTPCLFCRLKKIENCRLSHCFINVSIVLFFTLISLGLVYGESQILFKMGFPPTPKTVSFVIPPKGQYRWGEIFPMKIEIVGVKTPINAIQADLGFDPQKLEVVEIYTEDSFANIFIQKEINNQVGYARLTGGLPSPGFFADKGVFGTVYFKGMTPGLVRVEFLPSSLVLANDGRGTDVLKELADVSYLILPEKITEEEEEIQKELISQATVLGEAVEDEEVPTQIRLYQEERVLGAQVGEEIQREKQFKLGKFFLDWLEKIDRLILSLWGRLVE